MKFGKYIQSASSEWATPWYMEYKGLKKIISEIESVTSKYTLLAAPPPDDGQALKTAFFYKLDRELDKVNGFYIQKEAQLRLRLRTLSDKLRLYAKRQRKESLKILKEAHDQFMNDLVKLQNFVVINADGFRKILKKYDKRSKSATKDVYMARQVKTKPCFNSASLTELMDIASTQLNEIIILIQKLEKSSNQGHIPDSNLSVYVTGTSKSPSDVDRFDLDEFEADLQACILSNQVGNLVDLFNKRARLDSTESGRFSPEDLEILSRIFLSICNDASFEVIESFIANIPELLNLPLRDDVSDRTPVHELAISGRLSILRILVEKGLVVDSEDTYGRRPIHYASMHGHISCVLFLLSKGADIESPDHDGATPLVHAIRGGHTQLLEIMIESGAHLEYSSELIQNPLNVAVQIGNLEITHKLLKKGVQMRPDSQGLSPLHVACRLGYSDIAAALIKFGAPLNACDNFYGWHPIFFAASEGHFNCVRELIEAGCELGVSDEDGWFPATFALYHGHIDIAKLLEDSSRNSIRANQTPTNGVRPIAPNELFESITTGQDSEIDIIPSLSLPPPIIPCRIYGHNYLDKKTLIKIQFGSFRSPCPEKSPLRLFGSHQLSALKLEVTPKPNTLESCTVALPLKGIQSFSFMVPNLQSFSVQFDVYPMFGTKSIGRAMALPSIFEMLSTSSSSGADEYEKCICPLFDSHLNVVGEVEFEFLIIKPFSHPGLQIGGKVDTYWKSTAVISDSRTGSRQNNIPSLITSSSLVEEYLDAIVQITSDGIPVIYPYWFLPFENFPVYISSLTYNQAKSIFIRSKGDAYKGNSFHAALNENLTSSSLSALVYDSFLTLEDLLQTLPISLGICINIKYPTVSQRNSLKIFKDASDAHVFVERILKLVYDNASRSRSIIFSSFNPSICSIINWKQPNYGVFFGTTCGYSVQEGPWKQTEIETDMRCKSIKEAIKFAKSSNLLGLICEAAPIARSSIIINTIKESGMLLVTSSLDEDNTSQSRKHELLGVDAIMSRRIIRFPNS